MSGAMKCGALETGSAMVAMRMIAMVTTLMTDDDDHDEFDDDDAGDCGGDHVGDRCRYKDDERDDDDATEFLPSELYEGRRGHRGLGECCSYQYMALPCKNPIYTKTCPPPRTGGAPGPLTENGIRRGSALAKPGATVRLLQLVVLTECSHRPSGRQRRSGLRQQAPDFALALLRPVLAVWILR